MPDLFISNNLKACLVGVLNSHFQKVVHWLGQLQGMAEVLDHNCAYRKSAKTQTWDLFLLTLSNFTKVWCKKPWVAATTAVHNRDETQWLKVGMSRILIPLWAWVDWSYNLRSMMQTQNISHEGSYIMRNNIQTLRTALKRHMGGIKTYRQWSWTQNEQ